MRTRSRSTGRGRPREQRFPSDRLRRFADDQLLAASHGRRWSMLNHAQIIGDACAKEKCQRGQEQMQRMREAKDVSQVMIPVYDFTECRTRTARRAAAVGIIFFTFCRTKRQNDKGHSLL